MGNYYVLGLFVVLTIIFVRIRRRLITRRNLELKLEGKKSDISNVLTPDDLKKIPISIIGKLREKITSYYAEKIEEWDAGALTHHFSRISSNSKEKGELLTALFKQALNTIVRDKLAMIFIEIIKREIRVDHLTQMEETQIAKKTILESVLKDGKGTYSLYLFWRTLESQINILVDFERKRRKNRNVILLRAELIKVDRMINYKSDQNDYHGVIE